MQHTFPPGRLEAFSDGVIAVIITIMVLELKVPVPDGWEGLRAVLPTLLVYLLSYMFTGVYWVNHHHLIRRLHQANNRVLWSNLVWLFSLSLIPFFTNYVLEKRLDPISVQVYSICMLLTGLTFLLLRYAVDCQIGQEAKTSRLDHAAQSKHWLSLALYLAGILAAPKVPRFALLLDAAVTLMWILPTIGLRIRTLEAPEG